MEMQEERVKNKKINKLIYLKILADSKEKFEA